MIGRVLERPADDMRRGLGALARPLMSGALAGFGGSAPLVIGLALAIGPGMAVAVSLPAQLTAGDALAGRMTRSG